MKNAARLFNLLVSVRLLGHRHDHRLRGDPAKEVERVVELVCSEITRISKRH